jgi:hypothetical protein
VMKVAQTGAVSFVPNSDSPRRRFWKAIAAQDPRDFNPRAPSLRSLTLGRVVYGLAQVSATV